MHLLYCDETNFEKSSGDFFVYGGLVIDGKQAASLSDTIRAIREKSEVPVEYLLKFNPGPKGFSNQQFIELKQSTIKAAVKHGCVLLSNLLLHDIATSSDEARRNGINTICYHYDCYLARPDDHGLVLIDRFTDSQIDGQLKERHAVGVTGLPYSDALKLDRILGFHYSAIGQSHFSSLIDVILGSLRFSINAFTRSNERHMQSGSDILELLSPLFLREGLTHQIPEISLSFSPKQIKSDSYREKYVALKEFLRSIGVDAYQPITGEKGY